MIQTVSRRAFFNEIADSWDKRFQTQELTKFLEQLVPNFGLSPGQKVLDVGAGTGILIPFLLRAVGPTGQIEAVDYAEKMANICRSKYAHSISPRRLLTQSSVSVRSLILKTKKKHYGR